MRAFRTAIILLALIPLLTGALDLILGLPAARPLGLDLPLPDVRDAFLNSEMRSLGAIWMGVGVILLYAAADLERRAFLAKLVLVMLLIGGLGRLASVIEFGLPQAPVGKLFVVATTGSQLLIPCILLAWQHVLQRDPACAVGAS
jgi:Domain of unknown function (DUF4345)